MYSVLYVSYISVKLKEKKVTQEPGGTNGYIPAHSVNIANKFISNILSLRKSFNPQTAIIWGTPLERMTKELAIVRCSESNL